MDGPFPRPLSARERELIELLLSGEIEDRDALIAQIPHTYVRAQGHGGDTDPCIDLEVRPPAQAASGRDMGPITAEPKDATATRGELTLWFEDGLLSSLEFGWWSDEPPKELPSADAFRRPGVNGPDDPRPVNL